MSTTTAPTQAEIKRKIMPTPLPLHNKSRQNSSRFLHPSSALNSPTTPKGSRAMHVEDVFPSDEEEDEGPVQTSRTGRRDSALEAIENGEEFFIGSIDQGTTSSRFLIFDANGQPVAGHQIEFENLYPHSGWHEHDPEELISSVKECIEGAVKKFKQKGYKMGQIKSIGITNQRETTVCWDKNTGEPICNAVVWPDTRTTNLVRELKAKEGADKLQEIAGIPLSTYPSVVKLIWLLRNNEDVKKAYDECRLAFGTVDTWLIYKLNGGKETNVHVTDTSNASRTMFMNIHTCEYDDKLLEFFELDQKHVTLPKIVPSSDTEAFGKLATGSLRGVPICGCLGDQSAALVGQCAFKVGEAKNTYGTGCFLLYNIGEEPKISKRGLLTTVGYHINGQKPVYALEGSIAVAGSGIKFLQKNMGFIKQSSEIEELAKSVPNNGGVIFVTAFSGLFAPYWIDDAKGTLFGVTAHTQRGHIARATLEAMCYQTQAIVLAMNQDAGKDLTVMTVDGGVSDSDLCMQTQADIIGIPVERPAMRETTALGAAIVAGLAVGAWKGTKELEGWRGRGNDVFKPAISDKERIKMFRRWEKAVEMSKGWTFTEEELAAEDKEIEEQVEEDSKNKEEAEKKAAELEREKAEEKGEMRDGVPEISHPEEGRKSRRKSGLHPQRPISLGNLGRIESGVEGYEE